MSPIEVIDYIYISINVFYMISIQQMEYILTLSEELHFQRASEVCHVTQPTLSMQVKKAEEVLGQSVFDRSRSPLALTAFGKELVDIIRDVLIENSRIVDLVAKNKGTFKEEIRIAIIPTVAGYILPQMYGKWKSELNHMHLIIEEMKTDDIILAMADKKIDLAILAGPHFDSRLRTIPLFQEEIKAYLPNESKQLIALNELSNAHPWLLTSGNCLRTQMMHFCELESGNNLDDWDYEGGNIDLLQRMVEIHGGYTLVPENYIQEGDDRYKTITSETGDIPAREVIAILPNKTRKWGEIEKIIRSIQINYAKNAKSKFQVLSWK